MPTQACLPKNDPRREERRKKLEQARTKYEYKAEADNQLHPIAVAGKYPRLREERYSASWITRLGGKWIAATARRSALMVRFAAEKATFRFDKMRAYEVAFPGPLPPFGGCTEGDAAFAWWRIAGPNALSLRQEPDLAALRTRIPFDVSRVETHLHQKLGKAVNLATEAAAGRLFAVDFKLIQEALRPERPRDSRWREKYLPAPVGVFLEAKGYHRGTDLVPLAIQVDQNHPQNNPNPCFYPDGTWAWRIAKLYFEVADVSYHVGCGHVFRTHMMMEPFCVTTPRRLSERHPVFMLLRPHTRFTLPTNAKAYDYFINRRKTYYEFYAGTLEETRQVAINAYQEKTFSELDLERELTSRGVDTQPADYPYRDDARLWMRPIRKFVGAFIDEYYLNDGDVQNDTEIQQWTGELVNKQGGAIRDLVPGGHLDTKDKLVDVLSQVLFTAGPGHASQHYPSNHYYRYAPAFPGAAYAPPPWKLRRMNRARFVNTLPPISAATNQVRYNTFTDFKFDAFGDYSGYDLSKLPGVVQDRIRELKKDLGIVQDAIEAKNSTRMLPYDFLLPENVPNAATI